MLYIPTPDYSTRLKLLELFFEKQKLNCNVLSQSPVFNLSAVAFASNGFPAGSLLQAIEMTLPPRRVEKLRTYPKPFNTTELIDALSQTEYMYQDKYVQYKEFHEDVTDIKLRKKLKAAAKKQIDEEKDTNKKSNRKKRK